MKLFRIILNFALGGLLFSLKTNYNIKGPVLLIVKKARAGFSKKTKAMNISILPPSFTKTASSRALTGEFYLPGAT